MKVAGVWRTLIGAYLAFLLLAASVLLAGSTASAAEPIALRAGRLSMMFDADRAFLRYVKVGEHEILRGVNAPVRDQAWGTVRPEVSNVRLDNQGDHFRLTFDATCRERDIDFRWRGTIVGKQSGEVEFAFDGVANSTFFRNRIGLCVLHGPSAAGKPWIVEHVSGQESKGAFPVFISPNQPAKEIRSVSHELAKDVWAHVEFAGDVFEMEDQRNWTDASFKTYCTPLELPFPMKVEKGTKIAQKIHIRVDGDIDGDIPEAPQRDKRIVLTLGKRESSLPRIGLQVSSETSELTERQQKRLKELRLDHLYANMQASDRSLAEKLGQADRQAKALGVRLRVGVQLGAQPEDELKHFVGELKSAAPSVSAFCVNVTDWRQFAIARERLKELNGKALIGAAKGTNFVDLNRDRPTVEGLDFVSYAINPQIHAFDDASIVETLPTQGDTVRSARKFVGDRPLAIGPITLRPPPSGQESSKESLPPDVDARQATPFTAAWTLGSIKYLAEEGVDSATYFETVGWKGVMDSDQAVARSVGFPSTPGEVFAVYHVLRDVGDFAGGRTQQLDTSDSLSVVGLALQKPGKMRVLVANLTGHEQSIVLRGLDATVKVSMLVAERATQATNEPNEGKVHQADDVIPELPFVLPPRAIVRIDRQMD